MHPVKRIIRAPISADCGVAFEIRRIERPLAFAGVADRQVWSDTQGRPCAFGYELDGAAWMELPGVAAFRFNRNSRSVVAFAARRLSIEVIREAYQHAVLPVALQYFGYEALHASAVSGRGGAVAFCAVSETGKSTLAAAFSARGYPVSADDAVVLDVGDSGSDIQALQIPFRPRYQCAAVSASATTDRYLNGSSAGAFPRERLGALCVLERDDQVAGDVSIRRLTAARGLAALLPHAHYFGLRDAERSHLMMQRYLDICARIPIFAIRFQAGMERLPRILDAIEAAVPALRGR